MTGKMRFMAMACLLSITPACHRLASPEDRINAAVPVAMEVAEAKRALDTQAKAQSFDVDHIDGAFRDRLKVRALECARGYSPSWRHGKDQVRAELTDISCFEKFDHALAQWIGMRHAGLLLAAPPLRPIPAQPAPYLVASERISEGSFARQAGIAVLHTGKQHELFDLGNGERLQQIPREGRNFVVDISDNGRLLSLNQDQSTVVLDLEHGKPLLRLDNVRDQRLFWIGQSGALYVPKDERAPLFVDLLNDRESPIPTSINNLGTVTPTPVPGRHALLGSTRHAAIEVIQDNRGWTARLAQEAEPGHVVGNWPRGNLNADGTTFLGQQNGPALLDLRTLEVRKDDLRPLMTGMVVPTPDPDMVYLFGHLRTHTGIEHQALLYSPGKRTLAPAQIGKRLSSTMTYIPSIQRNALRDDFKLTLLDHLQASREPMDVDTFLQQLPTIDEIAPSATMESETTAAIAMRAALLAEAARGNGEAGADRELIALTTNADIETVGVYEGEGAVHGAGSNVRTPGTVDIHVQRGRPVILVLTSYEPVNWIIKPEPGAKVLAVLHGGYHPSQIHGAGDARIINLGRVYAYKRGEPGFHSLDTEVRQRSGKAIGRFQGTYRGHQFHVGRGGA